MHQAARLISREVRAVSWRHDRLGTILLHPLILWVYKASTVFLPMCKFMLGVFIPVPMPKVLELVALRMVGVAMFYSMLMEAIARMFCMVRSVLPSQMLGVRATYPVFWWVCHLVSLAVMCVMNEIARIILNPSIVSKLMATSPLLQAFGSLLILKMTVATTLNGWD